ncbi:MAG: BatA domain-containing protein [Brumimicrobium sp.]|nr:BatA domain-containing protein [Brumimicrobium sp.]
MKFVHPNILYFLLLLIIPIIIHLFNFRPYKRIYFSSLQFIKKIDKETSTTKKLRHYLILASRLLAFAFLIIAFAQPYKPTSQQNSDFGNIIPIYLDNSFSMSAKGNNGDLLNQAKSTIHRLVEEFPIEQRYMLVTNAMSGDEYKIISRAELEDKLENISLSPLSKPLLSPLESIHEYFTSNSIEGNHHYFVISDLQERNLINKGNIDTTAFFSFIQIRPQSTKNLYIDSVWFDQPFRKANTNNILYIRVQNTGDSKLENIELSLNINGNNRQTLADIEAMGSTIISMNYTDKTPGIKEGYVEVIDPNIYFDNRYYFSYEVKTENNIIIINGDNSHPYPSLVYKGDDYYSVQQISVQQIKIEELNRANLIVLNSIDKISSGLIPQLNQLVNKGISVLIIPSSQPDISSYNELMTTFKLPLFKNIASQEIRVGKINIQNHFFDGMFDEKINKLRMPPLKNYISSTNYTNANYMSLIDYENNLPMLVQNATNKKVFALYTPIDPNFNDFGKSALFSSVLLRIGEVSQSTSQLSLVIGSEDNFILNTKFQAEKAVILKKGDFEFIPEMSMNSEGIMSISVRNMENNGQIEDGIYTVRNNEKELGKLAMNFNRVESDMKYVDESDLQNYLSSIHILNYETKAIKDLNDIQQMPLKKPNEYWRILLILALAFFLAEMSLIKFWKI